MEKEKLRQLDTLEITAGCKFCQNHQKKKNPESSRRRKVCGQRYSQAKCASSLLNAGVDSSLVRLKPGNFQGHCHVRSELSVQHG